MLRHLLLIAGVTAGIQSSALASGEQAPARLIQRADVYPNPNASSTPIATLPAGHAIKVIGAQSPWLEIEAQAGTNPIRGYVKKVRTNF